MLPHTFSRSFVLVENRRRGNARRKSALLYGLSGVTLGALGGGGFLHILHDPWSQPSLASKIATVGAGGVLGGVVGLRLNPYIQKSHAAAQKRLKR